MKNQSIKQVVAIGVGAALFVVAYSRTQTRSGSLKKD